ncbi:hypothetical protein [Aeromicrobium sp.]|uniref:hypothetical protein n=1 Tax=Aeromicrobium sp. TaxID=1871063 RepID=UPI002FC69AD4
MKTRVGAWLIITAVLTAGCGGGSDEPSDGATSEPTATAQTSAAGGDTECLLGRWYLDTDNYEGQARSYLEGLGLPITALDIGGDQILDFNEEPYMSISTNLEISAVVGGQPLSVNSQSAGGGEWGWNADSETDIGVDNWGWTAAPGANPDGAPPLIDPSNGISVTCETDRLSVKGEGAPLTGVFVRR